MTKKNSGETRFPDHLVVRMPAGTKGSIKQSLSGFEKIADFMRSAVVNELNRRQPQQSVYQEEKEGIM